MRKGFSPSLKEKIVEKGDVIMREYFSPFHVIKKLNWFLAKGIRKIFRGRLGLFIHFIIVFNIFDKFIRPLILKINYILNRVIYISPERAAELMAINEADPYSLEFWLDPHFLPVIFVVVFAYGLAIIAPFVLTIQVKDIFKKVSK